MLSAVAFCSLALLVFQVQFQHGAASSLMLHGFPDDEDCNAAHFSENLYSYTSNMMDEQQTYEEILDKHRRMIFPSISMNTTFSTSVSGRYVHPFSKYYVINSSLGVLHIPKYVRVCTSWIRFLVGLSLKAKTFVFRLLIRAFRLFIEWPLHRVHLISNKAADMVDMIQYLLRIMFPELPTYQVEHVFEGYASGSITITVVYKRIFKLLFPEWPEFEMNSIFDGTDSLVVVLQRLAQLLHPNWPNSMYVFDGTTTVTAVFKKLLKLSLPSFDLHTVVSNSNSVLVIFEKVLMVHFPGWPNENSYLIGWTFLKLFQPYFVQTRPQLTYYQSAAYTDQQVIEKWMADIKLDISKEVKSSPQNIRQIFLMSFAGTSLDAKNQLASMFDTLFGELYGQAPSSTSIVIDTSNYYFKLKVGGFDLTSPTWNLLFPEIPMHIDFVPPPLPPRPKPTPGSGLHGGLDLFIYWRPILKLPVWQNGGSGTNLFCRDPRAQYMEISFNTWIQKLDPHDEVLRLLFISEPGFDISILKKENAVPDALMKLLFNWSHYQGKLTMYGKVPITNVIKFFLPALLYNWPRYQVMPIVRSTSSIRAILQQIFERMFATWQPYLPNSVTPVHLIFKRLLVLILPDIPKSELNLIFEGDTSFDAIFKRLFKVLFPRWPQLQLGYIPKNIDSKIVVNLFNIIFNWPKYESMLEVKSSAGLVEVIRKLILLLVPDLSTHDLDILVHNKVGLSLLISRFINILNPAHVIALDVNEHDEHTLAVPYWAFDILFSNWPHYEIDIADKKLKISPAFRRCLNWLRSQIADILHRASCSDPIVYSWVGELASALLEYSIETLPSVYEDKHI